MKKNFIKFASTFFGALKNKKIIRIFSKKPQRYSRLLNNIFSRIAFILMLTPVIMLGPVCQLHPPRRYYVRAFIKSSH